MSESTKKVLYWIIGILALVGVVYFIIWELVQNLMIGIDSANMVMQAPQNGVLTGMVPLTITNPTPWPFRISSIYASVLDPDGNVLASMDEPFDVVIAHNGTTAIPIAFSADVEAAAISAITQLFSAKEQATLTGKVYFLNGLVWYTFTETFQLKL